jgi:hypothetical protein
MMKSLSKKYVVGQAFEKKEWVHQSVKQMARSDVVGTEAANRQIGLALGR